MKKDLRTQSSLAKEINESTQYMPKLENTAWEILTTFIKSFTYFTESYTDLPREASGLIGLSVTEFLRKPIATCTFFFGGGLFPHPLDLPHAKTKAHSLLFPSKMIAKKKARNNI